MSLEPEAEKAGDEWSAGIRAGGVLDVTATNATSLLSIAISLKRIADALTYQPTGAENLHDMVNAIRHNTMPTAR